MEEKDTKNEKIYVAMYDVRGIQGYIYRTNKLKEIVAASLIVENIFEESLKKAIEQFHISSYSLEWEEQEYKEPKEDEKGYDVQVLFIGGGNAFVQYSSGNLCLQDWELAGFPDLPAYFVQRPGTEPYKEL